MKRLFILPFLVTPAMAQAPNPTLSVPASLVQKLWQAAGKAPYETVRPLEDELNAALHPPAPPQTSGTNYPDHKNNLAPGPQGGPGEQPVTPPPPSVSDDHHPDP